MKFADARTALETELSTRRNMVITLQGTTDTVASTAIGMVKIGTPVNEVADWYDNMVRCQHRAK